ncbi:sodium-dependent transporter [Alkaliphilus serpentinus]|uniref:Transporter n=1 Tax=Alkaliphilus serpentinus TaxID=1482731 RepID=A0A833HRW8_9FIRM|nr:sodium-dependent transporter [Alkaliphilus serpentinus]KAB3532712.1 sodium-dependent transporter [Alkaliphilus serpentinus]
MANLNETKQRDQWGSRIGFILAAAGSAVGLGNIWKFPYLAGANGGGAFVIVYFAILIVLGFTLMMAELTLGRHTQLGAVGAFRKLSKKWSWVGGFGVLAGFLILSFYSVVGGWVIKYIVGGLTGSLYTLDFGSYIGTTAEPIVYHAVFMILTLVIVLGGISGGIEKAAKILMPALFVMLILTMIRSLTLPGSFEGVKFLLQPDFSKINGEVILAALGQVFFSLSLGMGCMVTYGSYLSKEENLVSSSMSIPLLDTAAALIAGLAILPAVFAFNMEPGAGPVLLFVTLPQVFQQMPLGSLFGIAFFVLVLFAALSSSISLLEVVVTYFVDEKNWDRKKSTIVMSALIFLIGIPSSLGMGIWGHLTPILENGIMDSVGFITDKVLLPIGAMMLLIFIGWVWGLDNAKKEVTNDGKIPFALFPVWGFLVKFAAPAAIAYIFIKGLPIW